MPPRHTQHKTRQQQWDGDVQNLEFLGNGVSGIVFAIDSYRVAKIHLRNPRSVKDFETEREVYRRFNKKLRKVECRYVLRCLDTENPRGLVFERCRETVRARVRRVTEREDEGQILKWAKQAAKGLAWIHDCKVIQGDVGCHNMLLDSSDTIELADFAGSSIDNSEASIDYEVRSQLPDVCQPTKKSDIFALGSAIYEMATGHPPYEKLSYKDIQHKYRNEDWPDDVDDIPNLGNIIRRCWEQDFASAWDVVGAFGKTQSQQRGRSELRHEVEVFNDSAISVGGTPEPESSPMKTASGPSKSSRRHREPPTTYVHHTSHHRNSRYEKDREREGRKKHSHDGFISRINRFIHPRRHHDKVCYHH